MTSAEIFTHYAQRKQIYSGVNIVLFANVIYLVISLIRFSDITNSFIFSDITYSIFWYNNSILWYHLIMSS